MRSSDRIRDVFDSVKADEELKSLTKEYLKAARQKQAEKRTGTTGKLRPAGFRQAFAAVCVMLVLCLGTGGYVLLGVPVSYVSIDVNPSIELTLNRLDRVIDAEAYNEDGENILSAVSVWGMRYTDAIDRMVESDVMQPYLSGNAGLTFTVAADSGSSESRLLTGIEGTAGCRAHGGVGFSADIGAVQEAHDNGLSLGKYAAYQILSQYDSSITAQDCHDMTMSEIHGMIESHAHGSGHDEEHGGGTGHGQDVPYENNGYEMESETEEESMAEDTSEGYGENHGDHRGHGKKHGGNHR